MKLIGRKKFSNLLLLKKNIKPPKKNYKISIDKAKKSSSTPRPKMISVPKVSLPDLADINSKNNINQNHLLANASLGQDAGFGDYGNGRGGFENGFKLTLFGVESQSERIFIILDAQKKILVDSMGGIPGYRNMKNQVYKAIEEIPGGVLFNAIIYDHKNLNVLSDKMLRATDENKSKIKRWLEPINKSSPTAISNRSPQIETNFPPLLTSIPAIGKAIQVATSQGCDTIYLLSSGWEKKLMGRLPRIKNRSSKKTSSQSSKFWGELNKKVKQEIAKFKIKQNKARAKKGLPPKVFSAEEEKNIKRMFEIRLTPQVLKSLGLKKTPPRGRGPGLPPFIDRGHFEKYLKEMFKHFCTDRNKKIPVFNNLLFCAKKPESEHYKKLQQTNIRWLKKISSRYKGKFSTLYLEELKQE